MKLNNVIESTGSWNHIPTEVVSWLQKHVKNVEFKLPHHFSFENGELNTNRNTRMVCVNISDEDIPTWKFGKVGEIEFNNTCSFTKFDFLPHSIEHNLIFEFKMSLKGIHKRVKNCNILYVSKETTSGLLDIIRIENFKGLAPSPNLYLEDDLKKELIIVKFGYEDGENILDIQDKLIDAGLETFA
jgi:hypothetical protein